MKKITLLFLLLCMTGISYGQYLTEGFEGGASIPAGWTLGQTNTNETWYIGTNAGQANTGSNYAIVEYDVALGNQDESLTTPSIDLTSATNPRLVFWWNASYFWSVSPNDNYDFTVSVDNGTTVTQVFTETDETEFDSSDDNFVWFQRTIDLSAYVGETITIIFNYSGADGASLTIDDVLVEETPTCLAPTGVMATTSSTTEATISWTAGGSETQWTYEYGVTGFTQGSGTSSTTSMTSVDLTMLTPGETYDVYVQANCGVGDDSTWTSVVTFTMPSPPPANDLPSGAIAMTLDQGDACGANSITGISNAGTTDSGVMAPACGNYDNSTDHGDLWYTVVAPASGQITFNTENIMGLTSVAGAIYSGTVGSLTELDCTEFNSGWPWTVGSLTPGTTYYLRVWDFGNDQTGTFDLCGYFQSCLDVTDMSATVTSTTEATINWTAGLSETAWNYEWGAEGFTQGSGTTGTASTNPTLDLSGLTEGDSYDIYIQADCGGGSTSGFVKFTWTQVVSPANDECDNAIPITVNTDGMCTTVTAGTTVGATASSQADDVTGTPNTDVWFSFVASDATQTIELLNIVNQGGGTSTSVDMGMGVYDAAGGCNALTFVDDSDPNTLSLSGLTPNDTYYIRVYGWSAAIQYNTFDICVSGPVGTIVPNYTNDFSSFPGNGWSEASGAYGSPSGTTGSFAGDDFLNDNSHPNGRCAKINIFGTSTDEYLVSPTFDLSGATYYLNFDIGLTEWDDVTPTVMAADDYVALLVTQDGGTNWTELQRWDSSTTISEMGEAVGEITLSGYGSEVVFAFYAFSDTSNEDNDFFIDNFRITDNSVLSTSNDDLEGFSLFPTIVEQDLKFNSLENVSQLSVYNLLGQQVFRAAPNTRNSSVNLSSLKAGMYMVRVQVGDAIGTYKIVKE